MANEKITSLGITFDARQVAPQAAIEAVPAGWYSTSITDAEIKPIEQGAGKRLAIEWTILEGQYKGRKIFDGLNIVHSNTQAQQIAQAQFSAICHAIGVFQISDASQLLNRPHQIKVDVEPARCVDADNLEVAPGTPGSRQFDAKNRFKGAKAGSAPTVATSPSALTAPQPSWAAPATPATPPAAAVVPATPAAAPKGKPGRKPGKPAPVAAPVVERKFYVGIEAPEFADSITESKLVEYLLKGLPADTQIVLEGEETWKTPAEYKVAVKAPTPAATPAPAPAPKEEVAPWNR